MYKPLGKHVLIKPKQEKKKIVMAEMSKGQSEEGEILAIGEEVELKGIEVGDHVIFRKYSPEEFKVDGGKVYLVEDQDLMAVCPDAS